MYILHNWKIIHRTNSSGDDSICVGGRVYGNSRFTSGEPITTSSIAWYRLESGSAIVSTRNGSEYMLGKPSASEPFAKQRLIRHLQERGRLAPTRLDDEHTQRAPHFEAHYDAHFDEVPDRDFAREAVTSCIGDPRLFAAD